MNKLVFAITLFLVVPALRAQQAETKDTPPQPASQPAPQASTEAPNAENCLPAAIRPGHPLDPADVDILTGKGDREIEASRVAAAPILGGGYVPYGDIYAMSGRRGEGFDLPFLPLARITNPFFFGMQAPRGFGRGGFRGRR